MTGRRGGDNPFEELDDLFDRLTRGLEDAGMAGELSVDVSETDDAVRVVADLPGYDREDVNVTVADRRLTVEAERERSAEERDARFHRRERTHRRVRRTVTLPADVAEEAASATYENGVLTVTLPKRREEGDEGHSIDIE